MSHSSLTRRARPLFLAAGIAASVALAAVAGRAEAEQMLPLRECTNAAWADYNSCLMEADDWFHRKGCDIYFQAEYLRCWGKWGQDTGVM